MKRGPAIIWTKAFSDLYAAEGKFIFPMFSKGYPKGRMVNFTVAAAEDPKTGKALPFSEAQKAFATQCIEYAMRIPQYCVEELAAASERYMNDFLDDADEDGEILESEMKLKTRPKGSQVLDHVSPSVLVIPSKAPKSGRFCNTPVFQMELNCAWETEHGMEWVVQDHSKSPGGCSHEVVYVGGCNFHDPYDTPEKYGNFAAKKNTTTTVIKGHAKVAKIVGKKTTASKSVKKKKTATKKAAKSAKKPVIKKVVKQKPSSKSNKKK